MTFSFSQQTAGEWQDVVDAWQLQNWEEYRDIVRLGRKTRLPEQQRLVLWAIFEQVKERLREQGILTLAHMFARLEEQLARRRMREESHCRLELRAVVLAPEPNNCHNRLTN